ncbi:MAG: hypothetical protein ABSE21_04450 [Bryobacteraceae bacterium]|jgi:hypothetical protein
MGNRVLAAMLFLGVGLGTAQETAPQAESIVRRSLERDSMNATRLRDYTYTENQRTETLDNSGAVVKTVTTTLDVVNLYGRQYGRRIAKDGRPLAGKEKEKADEEFEREVRKRQMETAEERAKREAEQEKDRAEARKFLQEIPKACYLKLAGTEKIDGLPVWVIEATPRPDFRPTVKHADLLKKMRGKIWIDQTSYQWVRAEAEVLQPITFGGFLVKLDRGARMTFLQTRVNDEVWLPAKITARLDGRLLIRRFNVAAEVSYSGYRKFQVDSRVISGEEAPAAPR